MLNLVRKLMKKFAYILAILMLLIAVSGTGRAQDDVAVIKKAAERGDSDARHQLGEMYAVGKGVPKDYVQAYMWMTLAASETDNFSILAERERIANQMTLDQIVQARKMVMNWKSPQS
ncbi:MAG: hypothetical protein H7836_12570 [Magnetococcus sp. YQC-3]